MKGGGERSGGKRGRGAAGKTPYAVAVETGPEGKPVRLKLRRVSSFCNRALSGFALSRNAHFLLGLQEAKVRFVAADMPDANELTVGIMAVIAQAESKRISANTKAAVAAARARGRTLGHRANLSAAGRAKGRPLALAAKIVKQQPERLISRRRCGRSRDQARRRCARSPRNSTSEGSRRPAANSGHRCR